MADYARKPNQDQNHRQLQERVRRITTRKNKAPNSLTPWVSMYPFLDAGWKNDDQLAYPEGSDPEYPMLMICRDDNFAYLRGTIQWSQTDAIAAETDPSLRHSEDPSGFSVNVGATSGGLNVFYSNDGLTDYAIGQDQQVDLTLFSTAYWGYGPQGSLDVSIWGDFSGDSISMFTTGGYFRSAYQDDGVTPTTSDSNAAWHGGNDYPQHRVAYGIDLSWRLG